MPDYHWDVKTIEIYISNCEKVYTNFMRYLLDFNSYLLESRIINSILNLIKYAKFDMLEYLISIMAKCRELAVEKCSF